MLGWFKPSGAEDAARKADAARQELPIVEHTWPVAQVRILTPTTLRQYTGIGARRRDKSILL